MKPDSYTSQIVLQTYASELLLKIKISLFPLVQTWKGHRSLTLY